jgi:hypothetical protein
MFNSYYLKARLFPTILTSIPLIILVNNLMSDFMAQKFQEANTFILLTTNTSISAAIIFLLVLINRFISKEIFQRWFFQDEMRMPSTGYLLWSNTHFDVKIKEQIRNKITSRYDIQFLNAEEEKEDEYSARKLITTALSQVRNELRPNKMLLQHNIEYGFFRNLIGGSLIAFFASFGLIVYGTNISSSGFQTIGVILCLAYIFPLLLSKSLINKHGQYYAKILFEQFLSLK